MKAMYALIPVFAAPLLAQDVATEQRASPLANVFFAGSAIFGLLFLLTLVWAARPSRERQLERLRAPKPTQSEIADELLRLRRDLDQGRLPPDDYLEQRRHLVARAVDTDNAPSIMPSLEQPQITEKS